ncbi:MAG: hypothetical protein ACP5H0_06135, partial [Caldisericum sp.]|uniref:hypothetical protein n=1 Tax=Caldisericum sp. TaxID=2499687 RepID=UPI003D138601
MDEQTKLKKCKVIKKFFLFLLAFFNIYDMFVKVTKSGRHKYVSIVSAYRDKEKGIIKHKVILSRLDIA